MKRILLLLIIPLLITSCSKDEISNSAIVGIWETASGSTTFEFRDNGELITSGSYKYDYTLMKDIIRVRDREFKKNYDFSYTLDGSSLIMIAKFDAVFGGPFASEFRFTRKQ